MANPSERIIYLIEKQVRLLGSFDVECVIVGGVVATLHGSAIPTTDIDVCYARNPANLERVASALQSVHARLRNAPEGLPFILDAETLRRGLNLPSPPTLETSICWVKCAALATTKTYLQIR